MSLEEEEAVFGDLMALDLMNHFDLVDGFGLGRGLEGAEVGLASEPPTFAPTKRILNKLFRSNYLQRKGMRVRKARQNKPNCVCERELNCICKQSAEKVQRQFGSG
jgi:hypothetical protein